MVQLLLNRLRRSGLGAVLAMSALAMLPALMQGAPPRTKAAASPREFWELSLDGGRKLSWERSFSSESQVKPVHGFWTRLVDAVAGEPDYRFLVRPYSVATDSRGRIIVTDPGAEGVHIFDFEQHKYKFIERADKSRNQMLTPQCVTVDADDNIYVTDSDAGYIAVFAPNGKFLRAIGSLKGGEGYFKRPTGIAVDSKAQRIYVSDTLRDKIFVLDMQGTVLQTIGSSGSGEGQFNRPTELRIAAQSLLVVDSMNFRVQVFDLSGKFQYAVGKLGDGLGAIFRPKAVGLDSEGDLYVVDGIWGVVQVFNREGQLLYYFGGEGTHAGQFQLPTGLFIDQEDRVFVVDSFNRRVQVFRYAGLRVVAARGEGK